MSPPRPSQRPRQKRTGSTGDMDVTVTGDHGRTAAAAAIMKRLVRKTGELSGKGAGLVAWSARDWPGEQGLVFLCSALLWAVRRSGGGGGTSKHHP